jgi:hypothetical protein
MVKFVKIGERKIKINTKAIQNNFFKAKKNRYLIKNFYFSFFPFSLIPFPFFPFPFLLKAFIK